MPLYNNANKRCIDADGPVLPARKPTATVGYSSIGATVTHISISTNLRFASSMYFMNFQQCISLVWASCSRLEGALGRSTDPVAASGTTWTAPHLTRRRGTLALTAARAARGNPLTFGRHPVAWLCLEMVMVVFPHVRHVAQAHRLGDVHFDAVDALTKRDRGRSGHRSIPAPWLRRPRKLGAVRPSSTEARVKWAVLMVMNQLARRSC